MVYEKIEINISSLGLTNEASKEEIFSALIKKWLKYKIQASIRPDGEKNCVIAGGLRDDIDKLLLQFKIDGLFIKSETLGNRSTIIIPNMSWTDII